MRVSACSDDTNRSSEGLRVATRGSVHEPLWKASDSTQRFSRLSLQDDARARFYRYSNGEVEVGVHSSDDEELLATKATLDDLASSYADEPKNVRFDDVGFR